MHPDLKASPSILCLEPSAPGWSASPARQKLAAALFGAVALLAPAGAQGQLVWEDNFDGSSLDTTKWEAVIGNGCPNLCGWGNNELEYYRAENATVSGGMLTITAKEESFAGYQYTSARLTTKNLGDWVRGRFEMRAKLPIGRGLWPAFWLLPTDNTYGVWAASGEIDIMENIGQDPEHVFGTLHYGDNWPGNVYSGGGYTLPSGTFNDGFHQFALEWDEFEFRWYVDGIHYSTKTSWWSSGGPFPAPFDQRFHLLLNLAVGGNLPGSPNASTVFPQTYVIDYVRVYQDTVHDPGACLCVFDDMEHADPLANGYFTFDGGGASGGIASNLVDLPPMDGGSASLEAGWGSGGSSGYFGGFGRTNPLDLTGWTHFEMWINPDAGQDYVLEINLQDDDNGDNSVPANPDGADDEFQYSLAVGPNGPGAISGGGWQHISIPLASFVDDNSYHFGGDGSFDPQPVSQGGNGQLINVVIAIVSNTGADVTFRTDLWSFSRREGSVSGRLWDDINGNGLSAGEPGLAGITLELFDTSHGALLATVVTGVDGVYAFNGLSGGSLEVRVDVGTLPSGVTATFDPDGLGSLHSFALDLDCDEMISNQDFGYQTSATLGARYCSPAEINSTGSPATISAAGTNVALFNTFELTSTGLPTNQFGYYLTSATQGLINNPGGSQGHLCIGGQIGRFTQQVQSSGPAGEFSIQVDISALPSPLNHAVIAGETWNFTCWYRDSNPGPTSNFTDAISVTFQ